jgi:hypothetical protein
VRAQVDRDLTTVSCFDRLLGLIKNQGRHSLAWSGRPWIWDVDLLSLPEVCCICCEARMWNVLQVGGGGSGLLHLGGGRV